MVWQADGEAQIGAVDLFGFEFRVGQGVGGSEPEWAVEFV